MNHDKIMHYFVLVLFLVMFVVFLKTLLSLWEAFFLGIAAFFIAKILANLIVPL